MKLTRALTVVASIHAAAAFVPVKNNVEISSLQSRKLSFNVCIHTYRTPERELAFGISLNQKIIPKREK